MTWFYINLDIAPITYTRLKCTCTCNITVFQMALKVLSPRVVFLDTISVVHDSIFLLLSCSPDPVNSVYINHAARQSSFSCSWRLAYKQRLQFYFRATWTQTYHLPHLWSAWAHEGRGPGLQIQSFRISTTQGNNRI